MNQTKLVLNETCNTSFKNMIAESSYVNPTDKPALNDYFTAMEEAGGSLNVEYRKNVYNGNEWGRMYPQGFAKPLTYQWASIRSLTCGADQVDVDIKKCHPSILSALGKKHHFSTECLDNIVNNFDQMVAQLKINKRQLKKYQDHIKSPASVEDIAKFVYTSLLFGAGEQKINESLGFKLNPANYKDYKKGVKVIAESVLKIPEFYQIAYDYRAEKSGESKSDNACLSVICQELETRYVLPVIQRFQKEGLKPTVYIYDGFQCMADDRIQDLLDEINRDIPIRFIIKPWKAPLTLKMDFDPFTTDVVKEGNWDWLDGVTSKIANHFCEKFGEDFLYSRLDKAWYFWNGQRWMLTEDPIELRLKISGDYAKHLEDLADGLDGELHKKIIGIIHKVDDIVFKNKLVKECQDILARTIENWELNPYHFCFNNTVFDIRTGTQIDATNKEDLMTFSTGYDYVEPSEDQISEIERCVANIFMIEDERDCYMTILSTGLYGKTLDRFIMGNGGGGNGKNVINDLMLKSVGGYGTKMSPAVLQSALKTGASPETGVLEHKRFVISREPDENLPYSISSIKELTGGDTINARVCYSNRTTIANKGTYISEQNTRPEIDGKPDASVTRRLVDVLFRTSFVDEVCDDVEEGRFEVEKDTRFTDQSFQLEMRSAFFRVVLPYFKKFLVVKENIDKLIPKAFKLRMLDYVASSDQMYAFLNDLYEITGNPHDILTLRDFHNEYKYSEIFRGLTREQKRGASEKKTIDMIAGNVNFRRLYKQKYRPTINGKQLQLANVLVGVRLKRSELDNVSAELPE